MRLTSAEKKQRFIANLKRRGCFEEYKKKNAEHAINRRKQLKQSISKLTAVKQHEMICESRSKCRKRVEKHRKQNKEQILMEKRLADQQNKTSKLASIGFDNSYGTESALRKAVGKTKKSLPASPSKQKAVFAKLYAALNPNYKEEIINNTNSSKEKAYKRVSPELIKAIQEFYQRDDISRVSPNVRDCKRFVNETTGAKEYRQVRHLMYKLNEIHALFVQEYTEGQSSDEFESPIPRSTFCSLRPKHVQLVRDTPKEQCLCPYHSDFIQCCSALHKYLPEFPNYGNDCIQLLICDVPAEEFWFKTCRKCSIVNVNRKLNDFCKTKSLQSKPVAWQQWIKDKITNRTQNANVHGKMNDLMKYLIAIYPKFLKHAYIKREQWKAFVADHKAVDLEENFDQAIVHLDFAENFKCVSQDEIQAAHYNQRQISLFTTAMRHARKLLPKVIASDNTKHSKETLVAYLFKIFTLLPKTIKIVKIWSDGPGSQFKNKFVVAIIKVFEQRFKKKIFWNYFATSHGKGCVDGIGATVKKRVRRRIDSRKEIVNCTSDFVRSFQKEKSSIEVIEVNDKEIDDINKKLNVTAIFENAPTIKQIKSFHQLQFEHNKVVGLSMSKIGFNPSKPSDNTT